VRVNGVERAEIAIQESADHFAEPGVVVGKGCGLYLHAAPSQGFCEEVKLGALAAAVDAFDGDEFARGCEHVD